MSAHVSAPLKLGDPVHVPPPRVSFPPVTLCSYHDDGSLKDIIIDVPGDKLNDLRKLLKRGLNTWDGPPRWLLDLADTVERKML